jgi:VIT1/CCC1 family predicted Fe2+/Mn2+ transporter
MATKTAEGAETTGTGSGTEARKDDDTTTAGPGAVAETEETEEAGREAAGEEDGEGEADGAGDKVPSGVGQGAGAVVSAALGLVSLTGGWIGTVASAREQLIGQLRTSTSASVGTQLKEVYGDAWHTTALWAGLFALAALVTAVVVLVRPAFGAPGRPQAAWIRSVAWAGLSLGVIGLLLAVLKYSDALLAVPSAG